MVAWSVETLLLALYVIAICSATWISFKTMRQSTRWGAFMLLTFGAFAGLHFVVGPLLAGLAILAAQAYYVSRPYVWKTVGRIYVYVVLCWAGSTYIVAGKAGWFPAEWGLGNIGVAQAGAPRVTDRSEGLLALPGGRIWYRRVGVDSGVPLVLVHGGPGIGSYYLKSLEALGDERPIVRYDQLGSGRSDRMADTSRFNVRHFVGELDSLRASLGYDRMHVLGHSWGSIVAFEYYQAHPERVASLTLASPALNVPARSSHARELLQRLPEGTRATIAEREAARDFDAPDYVAAANEFNERFVWLRPHDADLDSTLKTSNRAMRAHMWGPSDFTITGVLRAYDATRLVRRVKVPTLYTVGEVDAAGPQTIRRLARLTPGSRFEIVPEAAHFTTWDNPAHMVSLVREFIRSADSTTR